MKIFTINGNKLANLFFAFFCMGVIVYVGILNHHTIVVTATVRNTIPIALVVDGFGDGSSGSREFLYMDIAFTGIVNKNFPMAEEYERLLLLSGREVYSNIDEIEFEVIYIDGVSSISYIEENIKTAINMAEKIGHGIIVARLGENGGLNTVTAISNILQEINYIEFVTVGELKNIIK
ncbi:MAG: hypothetical protein FWF57_07585 [Defluviitaleaceae bacterium]|nr:hypothetical protein [Defluviitaleaceae bacterium]